jgi:putative membrane protein
MAQAQGIPDAPLVVAPVAADSRVTLKGDDRDFAEKLTRFGMDVTAISQVATQRTSNPRVRTFAEKLIAEHNRLNAELTALATVKGVVLPAKDDIAEKWTKRDASDFDVEYLKKVIADHEDAVKLYQKQARDGNDAELVAFARKHLPAVQHHLEQALDLQRSMK